MTGNFGFSGTGIEVIVFDFDGVILESADIKTQAFLELFSNYPQHQGAILEHHLANFGISRYRKFEWIYRELLQAPLSDDESQRLGNEFGTIVREKILACPFVPGAEQALNALVGKYPLFVASGTPQEELDWVVEQRGLARYFKEVWGSPNEKKDILRDIQHRYNLTSEQMLFIGDGLSDYRAAGETGTCFLARAYPSEPWANLDVEKIPDLTPLCETL